MPDYGIAVGAPSLSDTSFAADPSEGEERSDGFTKSVLVNGELVVTRFAFV